MLEECDFVAVFFSLDLLYYMSSGGGDTTHIFDLPSNPASGGNISLGINEKQGIPPSSLSSPSSSSPPNNPGFSLDQTTINQIVSGLQQASSTGATLLPSRDIPQATQHLVQDPQAHVDYIPNQGPEYIDDQEEEDETEEIVKKHNKRAGRLLTFDSIYDEIQTPLLLSVLYFLFQLPIIRKYVFQYIPFLFLKDGNLNIYGFVFMSVLYGLIYYILQKGMRNFNAF